MVNLLALVAGLILFPVFGRLLYDLTFRFKHTHAVRNPSRRFVTLQHAFLLVLTAAVAWMVVPSAWASMWQWSAITILAAVFAAETVIVMGVLWAATPYSFKDPES